MRAKWYCAARFTIFLLITHEVLPHTLKLTKVVCNSIDKTFASFEKCQLKAESRRSQHFNLYLKFLQLPVTDFSGRFRFLKRGNGYKPFLYDFTMNCDFIKKLNPLTTIVWDWFRDNSNLNHSCPLVEDFEIKRLENRYLEKKLQGLPIPPGDYGFTANFTIYGEYKFDAQFYGTIMA